MATQRRADGRGTENPACPSPKQTPMAWNCTRAPGHCRSIPLALDANSSSGTCSADADARLTPFSGGHVHPPANRPCPPCSTCICTDFKCSFIFPCTGRLSPGLQSWLRLGLCCDPHLPRMAGPVDVSRRLTTGSDEASLPKDLFLSSFLSSFLSIIPLGNSLAFSLEAPLGAAMGGDVWCQGRCVPLTNRRLVEVSRDGMAYMRGVKEPGKLVRWASLRGNTSRGCRASGASEA